MTRSSPGGPMSHTRRWINRWRRTGPFLAREWRAGGARKPLRHWPKRDRAVEQGLGAAAAEEEAAAVLVADKEGILAAARQTPGPAIPATLSATRSAAMP